MDEQSFRIKMLATKPPHKLTVILQFTEDCAIAACLYAARLTR